MSHAGAPVGGLLVLVDPVARRLDGESVRIAKDVLSAGAAAKICLPDSQEEFARALARRGQRRLVIVGDDRALARTVGLLHRERGLADGALALVPVGPTGSLVLARSLGVPLSAVTAARAVLDGSLKVCDLLVDDSDGVVLGGLRIPPLRGVRPPAGPSVWTAYRSLVRTLVRPAGPIGAGRLRLRVEADGVVLADVDRPVEEVSLAVGSDGGPAEVVVRTGGGGTASEVTARAKTVTVSGADFRYRADAAVTGPVRRRTWNLHPGAWTLTLPR
ncbi:diacylglycerol kinase family protein [Streptomyces sp. NBC_00190]|uniref:diacylglycerol kinase n=1 Tax=unclassified Streptomyces TaxID=2593676 RepID=UPI002E2B02AD|nr:diacylglycerol kinase [Streptomyces sp. NBC_00190]WSZ45074.1 diacylglycerol kinase family protein [Streptomyces sp. NBC_00868]